MNKCLYNNNNDADLIETSFKNSETETKRYLINACAIQSDTHTLVNK